MNQQLNTAPDCPKHLLSQFLGGTLALLALASPLKAIVKPFDDNSELFVTGTASAAANDNIFLSHTGQKSSVIFDLVPGVSFESGNDTSVTQTKIDLSEDFQEYTSGSLSNQLANASLTSRYDDDKAKLNFDANFHQYDQAQVGIQNVGFLVKRDESHVDGTGEVSFTEKTSGGIGAIFDDTVYKRSGFTNYQYFEVPVNYYYKFEPKLDGSAGFRYRDNTLGAGGINSHDYYYNVGARGEFTPSLTGEIDVGYQAHDLAHGGNQGGLGLDSRFTYAYSPKTSVIVSVNDDFGYSALGGGGYKQPNASLGVNTKLDEQWSANAQLSYAQYQYVTTPQRDDFYSAQVGVSYVYNTNISFRGAYNYAQDSSNITADSFKNNIFTVSAIFRY